MSVAHFMTTVKMGPKGQIVIPKEIRDMFDIHPGDNLVIMADSERGIALHRQDIMEGISRAIFEGQGATVLPQEAPDNLARFAEAINSVTQLKSGGKP